VQFAKEKKIIVIIKEKKIVCKNIICVINRLLTIELPAETLTARSILFLIAALTAVTNYTEEKSRVN
jgi:hypothetical protein